MGKESRLFEILLNGVEVKGLYGIGNGRHLVTVELLCPRPQVASKSAARTYRFRSGRLDCVSLPWTRRIYFKEGVEFRFGLCVRISQSVAQTCVNDFLRYFAGTAFGMAADAAEDAFPGPAGNVAAIPLDYAKRKLVAAHAAATLVEGAVDLLPADLPESAEITVPLCVVRDIRRPGVRQLLHAEGDAIGTARLQLNALL